jgi:hypothetical protein
MLKLSKEQLVQFRRFIHTAKHASYDIPEQVSEVNKKRLYKTSNNI